ncbi:MAG: SDR family oxidoreductase [Balneolaceae bacterium]
MKILLTGATGYIGKRLLPILVDEGHTVVCCVRDRNRFHPPESIIDNLEVIEVDFLKPETLSSIPKDIDGAYYLIHSMSSSDNFEELERDSSINFRSIIDKTQTKHVVYLSGIVNDESLSKHLKSRKKVEKELSKGTFKCTTLRAGIIIGSGSASFEIIRDLAEKLPIMIAPKWLKTKCQPIGIRDVISFLSKALFNEKVYDANYDIAGPNVLTYKEVLEGYAKVRKLNRRIYTVPVMTPRLSSYWLYFITSTTYQLAVALVNSMKVEVVSRNSDINTILNVQPISYEKALERAFNRIDSNAVISSWKDSMISGAMKFKVSDFIDVPTYGCFIDKRYLPVDNEENTIYRIWQIGGDVGWYSANWLWKLRGALDKLFGGVGLRRGRTNKHELNAGDAVDFWRVLYADREEKRVLLFAEMKLPGEAWLDFHIKKGVLWQTATFRPKGILGRLYWFSVLPFHGIIFNSMIKKLAK